MCSDCVKATEYRLDNKPLCRECNHNTILNLIADDRKTKKWALVKLILNAVFLTLGLIILASGNVGSAIFICAIGGIPTAWKLLSNTPEDRIRNSIYDAATEIRDGAGSSLANSIFRGIFRIIFTFIVGAIAAPILLIVNIVKFIKLGKSIEQNEALLVNFESPLTVQQAVETGSETYQQNYRSDHSSSIPKAKVSALIIIVAIAVAAALIVLVMIVANALSSKEAVDNSNSMVAVPTETVETADEVFHEEIPITEAVEGEEPVKYAYINGTGVTLRAGSSTTSHRVATLKKDERVAILDSYYPSNTNEAICNTEIALYTDDGHTYTLPKGKAVKITSNDGSECNVSFVHPKYGKMTATVYSSYLESISGDKWYQIRRNSGETGWVFSKYVTVQY
jgi:hypothetical protein